LICELIRNQNIKGSCAELGVYKGYFASKIAEFLTDRKIFLYDTFDGFSQKDMNYESENEILSSSQDFSDTDIDKVLYAFDNKTNVIIRKGYFPQSIDPKDDEKFCLVSIDTDLYMPTIEGLRYFYPRVSNGGYILIHDYNNNRWPGIKKAVNDYFGSHIRMFPIPDKNGSVIIIKNENTIQ
jgi:O-methyltransferase